ncbi:hypothetical protein BDP27DRAFT_1523927 [Rhodocollybia butyracea]|uniref:F-box domain-containing protein n=1 Tax=Rhodocollybia butyracea TaxID=206335 RepID=A0A9P5P657_9AGAR|nr:hypothetical protein BDP27DRAFT_1503166 [Rhodocollybia butyracea]KAF9068792.1 hypothetical protein BDP27DRAFT_1523927 [Rhodocollybia butyracea]
MSKAKIQVHNQMYSKRSTSALSQRCSSFESAYQTLYTEFLAKSRHNNIPSSPVARDRLRALISQTRSDLQTCSESTTHNQILRVLELQESLLVPIRTLPSDVLINIFQLVIETSDEPGITYAPSKYWKRPFKLSGFIFPLTWICFWWRDNAFSYSAFWSRIALNCGSITPPSTEVTAFLNECILRSGVSAPMSIKISISLQMGQSPPAIVTMLVSQAHRWRQVALSSEDLYSIDIMFPFKLSSTAHFPLLEDLSVQCYDDKIYSVRNPVLECHPPLQKLYLSKLSESYADVIASRNLKVLELDRYYGVSLARLLHVFPCLESLTLGSFYFKGKPGAQQIPCRSSLLNLKIGRAGYIDIGAWDCVTLPKLTTLDVALLGLVNYDRWEADSEAGTSLGKLKEVVKQSDCVLQRVKLITRAEDYEEYHGTWPKSVLEIVEQFFEDLLVKPERCFVGDLPLQDWKEYLSVSGYY